ncbi:protein-tyrosine phosphatase-like protein [Umbelopsis sp. AD052]|nr:protein-tyrosine phosphatase-like protein [Umbelopsis sp. AD052]
MNVVFNSPSHSQGDSYFSPSGATPSFETNDPSQTPYFTAPLSPMLNTDFFQAVQARQASTPPFSSNSDFSQQFSPNTVQTFKDPSPLNFNLGSSISSRRESNSVELKSITSDDLYNLLPTEASPDNANNLLLLDVQSFVQYSRSHIRTAVGVSVPSTILRRPTFTLEKLSDTIVKDESKVKLKNWQSADTIVMYDQNSYHVQEASTMHYLFQKFQKQGFKGQLFYLYGGMDAFLNAHSSACVVNNFNSQSRANTSSLPMNTGRQMHLHLPQTPSIHEGSRKNPRMHLHLDGPLTAPMPKFENQAFNPFFSNIRQNLELSHGSIKERFPVRLPASYNVDFNTGNVKGAVHPMRSCIGTDDGSTIPAWLRKVLLPDNVGPTYLAETYEKIERFEQQRLQNIMHHHSDRSQGDLKEHPWSIVAGIEMGTLNRYTNVWPFEYTRVKLSDHKPESTDYINASHIQYIDVSPASLPTGSGSRIPQIDSLAAQNESTMSSRRYRRYISTQGPLPTTFDDFYNVIWEQHSYVIVMLTKEEEMNRIKCHRYWPSSVNETQCHGKMTVTLISEESQPVLDRNGQPNSNPDEVILVRKLALEKQGSNERRVLTQIQYMGWMDFGVPEDPLGTLRVIEMAGKTQTSYEQQATQNSEPVVGPMIVHCSAGCGRTGAFCTIDTLMTRLTMDDDSMSQEERLGQLDILRATVEKFREQRVSMVQTLRQFAFCYEATLWWILNF